MKPTNTIEDLIRAKKAELKALECQAARDQAQYKEDDSQGELLSVYLSKKNQNTN